MRLLPRPVVLLAALLAVPAWAQESGKPLDLSLPPGSVPAPASSAARPAARAPGVYYGDTSGRTAAADEPALPDCDDATYHRPQVHGSVGTGVLAGNRVSGQYQGGTVQLSQAFGSCENPGGGVSISIGGSRGEFHRRGH